MWCFFFSRCVGVENCTNRNIDLTFLFDFYTHDMHILHRLATMHNAADTDKRQTYITIGMAWLCNGIMDLMTSPPRFCVWLLH